MIVIDGDHTGGNLSFEIERLERLLADLKRLASGRFPAVADIANAPRIDDYAIAGSELWAIAPAQEWARTLSRAYRLGCPWRASAAPNSHDGG